MTNYAGIYANMAVAMTNAKTYFHYLSSTVFIQPTALLIIALNSNAICLNLFMSIGKFNTNT